jgi:hypothetical protein
MFTVMAKMCKFWWMNLAILFPMLSRFSMETLDGAVVRKVQKKNVGLISQLKGLGLLMKYIHITIPQLRPN